ncbi:hypothetical protein [Bradyrhizobium sp. DOA1]|nr:hypothetical protein [Bradyrhizobium sp. DOA1]
MAEKEPEEPALDPQRDAEARRIVQEYIDELRVMMKRLGRKLQ